jgi:hypothetical protein
MNLRLFTDKASHASARKLLGMNLWQRTVWRLTDGMDCVWPIMIPDFWEVGGGAAKSRPHTGLSHFQEGSIPEPIQARTVIKKALYPPNPDQSNMPIMDRRR